MCTFKYEKKGKTTKRILVYNETENLVFTSGWHQRDSECTHEWSIERKKRRKAVR
jgi:hypothetical protein